MLFYIDVNILVIEIMVLHFGYLWLRSATHISSFVLFWCAILPKKEKVPLWLYISRSFFGCYGQKGMTASLTRKSSPLIIFGIQVLTLALAWGKCLSSFSNDGLTYLLPFG